MGVSRVYCPHLEGNYDGKSIALFSPRLPFDGDRNGPKPEGTTKDLLVTELPDASLSHV
jgi:hypothetical protein